MVGTVHGLLRHQGYERRIHLTDGAAAANKPDDRALFMIR
jgi:hypothetical protein